MRASSSTRAGGSEAIPCETIVRHRSTFSPPAPTSGSSTARRSLSSSPDVVVNSVDRRRFEQLDPVTLENSQARERAAVHFERAGERDAGVYSGHGSSRQGSMSRMRRIVLLLVEEGDRERDGVFFIQNDPSVGSG